MSATRLYKKGDKSNTRGILFHLGDKTINSYISFRTNAHRARPMTRMITRRERYGYRLAKRVSASDAPVAPGAERTVKNGQLKLSIVSSKQPLLFRRQQGRFLRNVLY